MIPAELEGAVSTLAAALAAHPELEDAVRARWHADRRPGGELADDVRAAADLLAAVLPGLTQVEPDARALGELMARPGGEVLVSWCSASAWRRDIKMAPLLGMAAEQPNLRSRVAAAA